VPPANPTRWVQASRVGDFSIDVRGAPAVKPSEVTVYFVTYPSGTLVDHRGPEHLPLPPWVTGLSVAAAAREHDALRPADLKEGQSIVRVTFGPSTGKPGSRDHYSTTLTNVSSRPVRVLKFGGYTRSGGVFVLNTVSAQFFTAAEFREWYGQSGEWIGPGESAADPNNYGSPPVLWAYYCEDEQGHAFVTGGIIG
jgi:hypothetical protein